MLKHVAQNVADKPTIFVIFGATGDLASKKIFPSFFNLYSQNLLPNKFKIIAVGRGESSSEEFTNNLKQLLDTKDKDNWTNFANLIEYFSGNIADGKDLDSLPKKMDEFEQDANTCVMRVLYLAISHEFYEKALNNLGKYKLNLGCSKHGQKARLVIEKPFGHDYQSSQKLQENLSRHFDEDQIYRIDHYLGKETVQNIITFRFGNELFEPLWSNKYIDSIQITAAEYIGIEKRGAFYDKTGALRDVVQNHLLQLVSLITMEQPQRFERQSIRSKKIEIVKSIKRMSPEDVLKNTVRGQYKGYLSEENVTSDSQTETYAFNKFEIDSQRWSGVPIYVRHGKKLMGDVTSVIVSFKERGHELFENFWDKPLPNHITIQMRPNEGIGITLVAKKPGLSTELEPINLEYCYPSSNTSPIPDAHERLLMDIISGDQTLFLGQVGESWKVIDPIEEIWQSGKPKLEIYKPGSWGPVQSDQILAKKNHHWLSPILTICKI